MLNKGNAYYPPHGADKLGFTPVGGIVGVYLEGSWAFSSWLQRR